MSIIPLDHYSLRLKDPSTIIVVAHFIRSEEGFMDVPSWATMTINLLHPVTNIDEQFHAAQDDPAEFEPADLSHFYGIIDEEDQDALWVAEGKDPKEERANIARWLGDSEEENHIIVVERWRDTMLSIPDEQELLLYCISNSPNSFPGDYYGSEFRDDKGNIVPIETISYWMPRPKAPTR